MKPMTFDEYQVQSLTTAIPYSDPLMDKTIYVMGVAGEAGEVLEKWKKIVAYKDGSISASDISEIKKELGDIVWYIAVLAERLGLSFDDIARTNLDKQLDRQKRGVQKGEGDNR
jgi:NTP pyrophosphatase (non-canonical NTP hydrolase)